MGRVGVTPHPHQTQTSTASAIQTKTGYIEFGKKVILEGDESADSPLIQIQPEKKLSRERTVSPHPQKQLKKKGKIVEIEEEDEGEESADSPHDFNDTLEDLRMKNLINEVYALKYENEFWKNENNVLRKEFLEVKKKMNDLKNNEDEFEMWREEKEKMKKDLKKLRKDNVILMEEKGKMMNDIEKMREENGLLRNDMEKMKIEFLELKEERMVTTIPEDLQNELEEMKSKFLRKNEWEDMKFDFFKKSEVEEMKKEIFVQVLSDVEKEERSRDGMALLESHDIQMDERMKILREELERKINENFEKLKEDFLEKIPKFNFGDKEGKRGDPLAKEEQDREETVEGFPVKKKKLEEESRDLRRSLSNKSLKGSPEGRATIEEKEIKEEESWPRRKKKEKLEKTSNNSREFL